MAGDWNQPKVGEWREVCGLNPLISGTPTYMGDAVDNIDLKKWWESEASREVNKLPAGVGQKHDTHKSRVDLLDPEWVEGIGNVLRFGAEKYAAHNWRSGIQISRLLGAGLRHCFAFLRGESYDPESGLHHLLHASCCLMFSYWTVINKPQFDDRYKK